MSAATVGGGEAAVLAIDLGTTEVKVGLVALDGRLLGLARAGYATDADPATGRAEQDPEAWWARDRPRDPGGAAGRDAATSSRSGSTATARPSWRSTQTGSPTHPAIIWQDTRSTAEQAELADATGLQGWSLAGLPGRALAGAPRARGGRGDALVPRDVGRHRAAPDRHRRARAWPRASRSPIPRPSTGPGCPARRSARRSRPAPSWVA